MSWIKKLKAGLTKTSSNIVGGLSKVFIHKKLDNDTLEEFEELLISNDLGPTLSMQLAQELSQEKFGKEVSEEEIKIFLSNKITKILELSKADMDLARKPSVLLFCGVNGNGKTTTVGKLAAKFSLSGKKVLVAACDTFRAAAEEQLLVWTQRSGVEIIRGEAKQDPASVAYQALEKAQKENFDILLIDTAGRLHTKQNLMDELNKIIRAMKKLDESAPHYSILVLDATTGGNALEQIKVFDSQIKVDGLIITKLDGTAKGGIALAISDKFKKPIYYLGVGEQLDDLDIFDPTEFAKSLVNL